MEPRTTRRIGKGSFMLIRPWATEQNCETKGKGKTRAKSTTSLSLDTRISSPMFRFPAPHCSQFPQHLTQVWVGPAQHGSHISTQPGPRRPPPPQSIASALLQDDVRPRRSPPIPPAGGSGSGSDRLRHRPIPLLPSPLLLRRVKGGGGLGEEALPGAQRALPPPRPGDEAA